jgi:hypothetical protein
LLTRLSLQVEQSRDTAESYVYRSIGRSSVIFILSAAWKKFKGVPYSANTVVLGDRYAWWCGWCAGAPGAAGKNKKKCSCCDAATFELAGTTHRQTTTYNTSKNTTTTMALLAALILLLLEVVALLTRRNTTTTTTIS